MISNSLYKSLSLLLLLVLPLLAWLYPIDKKQSGGAYTPESVNLALRRTADALLRAAGDSTSRIPAIEQTGQDIWQVRLEKPFDYDQLPAQLQASLDVYNIKNPYEVTVRRCTDDVIDLGYLKLDFIKKQMVPCSGREMPEGCHYIEIKFLGFTQNKLFEASNLFYFFLIISGIGGFLILNRKKKVPPAPANKPEPDWLELGNSRLDVAGQVLICNGATQSLTFRETKLLRLFATNIGHLLERDYIIQQVWADEGVLVGRSVDVFVSRLRKKLAVDPSVGIVAVHGVGYRLENGK